tara:strand:- start:481 stop:1734 length:1254 start_codon:yes stop_codon:yes gene_type:complete
VRVVSKGNGHAGFRALGRWLFLLVLITTPVSADEKTLKIYHDADRSVHAESAQSIERGIHTALAEVNYEAQGYTLEFVPQDHRGNVLRSKLNFQAFLKDPTALVMFSGIHSPPLIRNRKFINENKILTLVPWAAGGPITRFPSTENWVFRLSLDDTQVGAVLVNYALKTKHCKAPHLLLENTPWGDSNRRTMGTALVQAGILAPEVSRFGFSLKRNGADYLLRSIKESGGDCIILVANAVEGSNIANAMASLPEELRMPIISHWGISAGNFHEKVPQDMRARIDLNFIQSCFSFNKGYLSKFQQTVLGKAQQLFPEEVRDASGIKSPVGFIHGYDLTRVMLKALEGVEIIDDMSITRDRLRRGLESLQQPVQGLIRVYEKPFSVFNADSSPNAHEALNAQDYCMAYYGKNNEILLVE